MKEAGTYHEDIGIRTDISFPFQSLALVVSQDIYPRKEHRQTVKNCVLYDKTGKERGNGISRFQNVGDSLRICITHNMRREMMTGISDIGFILTKK